MKRVFASAALAAVCAVGVAAQTPASSPMAQSEKDAKAVTLTGCVRAGDTPESFVLANVKADKGAPAASTTSTTVGTSGTTGAPATTTTTTTTLPADIDNATVKLASAPPDVNLSAHVGHTVAITGSLAPAAAQTTSTTATTGTTGSTVSTTAAPASADKAQHTLNVSSLTMVSATCGM